VAVGLQFLALNGWQADLDPPGAALTIIEGMARERLGAADAAAWLSPRLSPYPAPQASYLVPAARKAPMTTLRSRATRLFAVATPLRRAGVFSPVTGFLPFTDDARGAVIAAQQEAGRLGLDRPGSEQFLLGLIATGQGSAAEAPKRLGISPEAVREEVTQHAQDPPQVLRDPDTPHPMRVMPRAVGEAVIHGHDYIGSEHILLALFYAEDHTAAQALATLGAGEREVRAAVAALLPMIGPARAGHRRGRKPPAREDEIRRLRLEIARLSDLLREHRIEPGGGDRRSA
jgi:hypothetical protein